MTLNIIRGRKKAVRDKIHVKSFESRGKNGRTEFKYENVMCLVFQFSRTLVSNNSPIIRRIIHFHFERVSLPYDPYA